MGIITTDQDNYNNIADAIRFKNGTSNTYKPREMSLAIRSLTGSGSSLQMQSNKTSTPSKATQYIKPDSGYDGLLQVTVNPIPSNYYDTSDATIAADDIKQGEIGYGPNGKVVGTYVASSGSGGIDTSDATAEAYDIVSPKTAYVNGEKITGTLQPHSGTLNASMVSKIGDRLDMTYFNLEILNKRYLFDVGSNIAISAALSQFGDAEASDVAAGKTFTSVSGYKVTGTGESSGGSGGMQVKNGTTTSTAIDTGLSSIIFFGLQSTASATGVGLCNAIYNSFQSTGVSMSYCSSSSQYLKMYSYLASSTSYFSISGGTITWTGTGNYAFQSDMEYAWFAVGE